VNALTFRQAVWLIPLAFSLHVLEEWPRFTAWANRYASVRFAQQEYATIHLGGIAGAFLVAALAAAFPSRPLIFLVFALFFLPAMFWNSFFHAGATIAFRAYCPGLATAVGLYPLVVYAVTSAALREGWLDVRRTGAALLIAGAFHAWEVGHNVFKAW